MQGYAELWCASNFSFLRGASHPDELVERAHEQGYAALALTDECSVAGVVRAHLKAKELGIKLIIGTELVLEEGMRLVLLAPDRAAYTSLCRLITRGRRSAAKGSYALTQADVLELAGGCFFLLDTIAGQDQALWLARHFAGCAWLALALHLDGQDQARLEQSGQLAQLTGLPVVAVGDVLMHRRGRRALADVLAATRQNRAVTEMGFALQPNGERHLRSLDELAALYPADCLAESLGIAARCHFSLDEIAYQYPDDVTPSGTSSRQFLRQLCLQGMDERWPQGCPERVRAQIEHELDLIGELNYQAYFLTVWDIVRFARGRGILCQGRGSAANSSVCYCLGITEIDPARMNLLFERFISRERGEPPDIDVDFEHERREEVIQYIYAKYGRGRAALAAAVITYRSRSAVRDLARALGFSAGQIEQLAKALSGWRRSGAVQEDYLREAGFDPDSPQIKRLLVLANSLRGFPRHLSQHVGGFVIAKGGLDELVPVENAAMPGRTLIQWDKDDLEALGLLKVDILALGMLSAIRKALDMIGQMRGAPFSLRDIPAEDPKTYRMIQQADTVGVFQIESRAQMAMLPRLKPERYYDLVIEVALVRPGPIQGDMVHPYLNRRSGREAVDYPSEAVREVLERTLGVPIFQEQVIKLAMVAAGFSAGEADQLRRAMGAWKKRGGLEIYQHKLYTGMLARGYSAEFAERIFQQIQGFGEYGFPESHAASFALLVYASAWIKCHYPAIFVCTLINSQPMGFYAPAQLLRDAVAHGVQVLPADVLHSGWDCALEQGGLRLGLRLVKGLSRQGAERLVAARTATGFRSAQHLAQAASLDQADLKALAAADALASLSSHRHQAYWDVAGVEASLPLFGSPSFQESLPGLLPPLPYQDVLADYAATGLSLKAHPLSFVRSALRAQGILSAAEVAKAAPDQWVRVAGLVLSRQRPGKGNAVFITLEDETGILNLIVWKQLAEAQRRVLLQSGLLGAFARVQREAGVQHLIAGRLEDHSHLLGALEIQSRDFH